MKGKQPHFCFVFTYVFQIDHVALIGFVSHWGNDDLEGNVLVVEVAVGLFGSVVSAD